MPDLLTIAGVTAVAAAYAALALSLRPGKVLTDMPRLRLRVAALFTVVWNLAAWSNGAVIRFDPSFHLLLSLTLIGVWSWQLNTFARWRGLPTGMRRLLEWGGVAVFVASLGWMVLSARFPRFPEPRFSVIAMLGVALATVGMVSIEQLYRNAVPDTQRALRWLLLGMGGVLLIELVGLAEMILLGTVSPMPGFLRACLQALCALAMIRGARLMPRWQTGLSVSRHVVFYAGSFLLIGGYLVLIATAGWLILRVGSGWQIAMELGFLLLAGLGLGLSLFSGGVFQRLKVLISAHFYPHLYDYRREWMRFTRTMSEGSTEADLPRHAIRALAQIMGSESGQLWRLDPRTQAYVFSTDWPSTSPSAAQLPPLPADHALPAYLQRTAWLIDLAELARRSDLYGDLQLNTVALGADKSALIVPLLNGDSLYGWIILSRGPGKGELNFEDRDILKTAGRQVAAHLSQADAAAQLAEANQFETFHRMTAFVMHDLKNVAAQLRLISQNAERHRSNPAFVDDSFRSVAAAAARMSKLITQLATDHDGAPLQTVDLASCAEKAAVSCSNSLPIPQLTVETRSKVVADQDHLVAVIEHAIRNAQEATPPEGEVRIEVGQRDGRPVLAVLDTGAGMDANFLRDRLFRPFDTTKGTRGMGIGAFQIREYLRSLGGDVEVHSNPGEGTNMTLLFAGQTSNMTRMAG